MYFAMPVSPDHLLAATVVATVAREDGELAERTQLSRTIVVAADHRAHRHVLGAQLVEDGAAHATGAGDENAVAGNHRLISLAPRRG